MKDYCNLQERSVKLVKMTEHQITAELPEGTLKVWKAYIDALQPLKQNNCQPRMLCPVK